MSNEYESIYRTPSPSDNHNADFFEDYEDVYDTSVLDDSDQGNWDSVYCPICESKIVWYNKRINEYVCLDCGTLDRKNLLRYIGLPTSENKCVSCAENYPLCKMSNDGKCPLDE